MKSADDKRFSIVVPRKKPSRVNGKFGQKSARQKPIVLAVLCANHTHTQRVGEQILYKSIPPNKKIETGEQYYI